MSETKPKVMHLIEKWEDSAFENGRIAERERIIKMILDNMDGRDSWLDVIALIKGEQ